MSQMTLVPTPMTQQFLTRYRLLPDHHQGCYSLNYYGPGERDVFMRNMARLLDNQPLQFVLKSQYRDFYTITDLPVQWCGDLVFSSQDADSKPADNETELTLSLAPRTLATSDEVGRLAIFPQHLWDAGGEGANRYFAIRFNSRRTHWYYTLFNRSKLKLNSPMITDHQDIDFESGIAIKAQSGEKALLFRSGEHRFMMHEKPQFNFQLVDRALGRIDQKPPQNNILSPQQPAVSTVLLSSLPQPDTDKVNINGRDGQQYVYSQMYLYL